MRKYAFIVLLALAAALIITGVLTGGALVVERKAIRVCLECIGLGT